MTYLEMTNEVLRRLRENTVSAYNQTTYSTMVGDFINDAKNQVESAWDWSANRTIITVTTAASTQTYSLTGFGQQGKVISVFNDTKNREVHQVDQKTMDRWNYTGQVGDNDPTYWCFRGEDSNDDAVVEFWPVPGDVHSIKFNCVVPQDELAANGTVLQIPWRPVVLLATAMLAEEKGETGGINTSGRYWAMADQALSDAIAYDAARHPFEAIWYEI